jgi:predicted transglutaminase-like cysteine proteinase
MSLVPYTLAESVQASINACTTYTSDIARYQAVDFWEVADNAGDCEDYALAKRAALLAGGANPDYLHLALCWTETAEFHAVLVVDTERGSYVLDNRHAKPMPQQDLGYRWHSIQEGKAWHAL